MKVQRLGLETGRGIVYAIAPDGRILKTKDGETTIPKKVKLTATNDFLYAIDDEGDLIREYKDLPQPRVPAWPKDHPTQPASAKLGTRELVKKIDALLFPPERIWLAHSGFVGDAPGIRRSRAAHEKELARLVDEISYALGPGELVETDNGDPGVLWKVRGRTVMLSLNSEDVQFPAAIELERISEEDAAKLTRRTKAKSKKRA